MYINFIVKEAQIFFSNFLLLSLFFKKTFFCLWIIFKDFLLNLFISSVLLLLLFFAGGGYEAHGILAPWLESKPTLPGRDVLATGPPGKFVLLLALGQHIQAGYQTKISICRTSWNWPG